MPDIPLRHRHALALTFAALVLAALVGGAVNTVDARGVLVDDFTDRGVPGAKLTHGARTAKSDELGEFEFRALPRTSRLRIDASGYLRASASPTETEIRLSPLSVTIYVSEEGAPDARVRNPQARQGNKILATGNESGQITVIPHPGKDATLLICAEGYESRDLKVEGVLQQTTLKKGGSGCPPLPTPSPSPAPSPTVPAPSPSPTRNP